MLTTVLQHIRGKSDVPVSLVVAQQQEMLVMAYDEVVPSKQRLCLLICCTNGDRLTDNEVVNESSGV